MHLNRRWLPKLAWLFASIALLNAISCRDHRVTIAAIPRTTATPIWEAEHLGIRAAVRDPNVHIYWNAPTREDDVEGQIALIQEVMNRHYDGLILAPDNSIALVVPVRRALESETPVVIVGSPLLLSASKNLCYLLNDEETGARLAAARVALILHGRGAVAILGVNPDVIGIIDRARILVSLLKKESPDIHIIDESTGTFDEDHERQTAMDLLDRYPNVDAIVALSSATTSGVLDAMSERGMVASKIKIVAFDRDDDERLLFDTPSLDSIVMEDTEQMGAEAARQILGELHGRPMCSIQRFKPVLVTRDNLHEQMRQLHSMEETFPPAVRSRWMITP